MWRPSLSTSSSWYSDPVNTLHAASPHLEVAYKLTESVNSTRDAGLYERLGWEGCVSMYTHAIPLGRLKLYISAAHDFAARGD